MICAVVFDFKETLARVIADGPSIADLALARGLAIAKAQEPPPLVSDSSSQEAFENEVRRVRRQTLRRAGATDTEIDEMFEEVETGRGLLRMELFPEVLDVLHRLRSAGQILGICSNWDWNLDTQLAALGIAELFAAITCSARCGFWKPHPRIFKLTARSLSVPSSEILFVGDNYRNDIQPAEGAGMRAFHVHREPCTAACERGGDSLDAVMDHLV